MSNSSPPRQRVPIASIGKQTIAGSGTTTVNWPALNVAGTVAPRPLSKTESSPGVVVPTRSMAYLSPAAPVVLIVMVASRPLALMNSPGLSVRMPSESYWGSEPAAE